MSGRSPAQLYALIFGLLLTAIGIVGFFYNASFATGHETLVNRDSVFGILAVNGWSNVVHILTGVLGLLVAFSYGGARAYALWLGAIYIVLAILGFAYGDGDSIFKLIPVNTEDNLFHVIIGLAGIGAGLATDAEPGPTTVTPTETG